MSNMSYCRFHNTYFDLLDCYECMDDIRDSEEETKYRERLIKLCEKITAEYGNDD